MIIRSLFARLAFMVDSRGLHKFDNGIKDLRKSVAMMAAAWAAGTASIGYFLNEAAKMEQVKVAFKTMLGSVSRAKVLLADLFEFARITPFRIPGILGVTRILLGMGVEADKMKQRLKEIGDVAAGLSVPLEQIALSYGKVKAAGYLTGYELQNLRRAGVPLVAELEKMTGKSREQIQHMVRTRQISFETFAEAFTRMSGPGGKFHDLMFEQSKTLLGIISNIQDAFQIIAIEVGEVLLPEGKRLAKGLLDWLEVNKQLIKIRLGKALTKIARLLGKMSKIVISLIRDTYHLAVAFGGVEKVLKFIAITLGIIIGLKFVSAIGKMTMAVWRLTAAFFTMNTVAGLWPIIIGASVIALYIILADLYHYLTGKEGKSVAEWFDKKFLGGKMKEKFSALKENLNIFKEDINELIKLFKALGFIIGGAITFDFDKGGMFREGLKLLGEVQKTKGEKGIWDTPEMKKKQAALDAKRKKDQPRVMAIPEMRELYASGKKTGFKFQDDSNMSNSERFTRGIPGFLSTINTFKDKAYDAINYISRNKDYTGDPSKVSYGSYGKKVAINLTVNQGFEPGTPREIFDAGKNGVISGMEELISLKGIQLLKQ